MKAVMVWWSLNPRALRKISFAWKQSTEVKLASDDGGRMTALYIFSKRPNKNIRMFFLKKHSNVAIFSWRCGGKAKGKVYPTFEDPPCGCCSNLQCFPRNSLFCRIILKGIAVKATTATSYGCYYANISLKTCLCIKMLVSFKIPFCYNIEPYNLDYS